MIQFFNNQFSGETVEGHHRTRAFYVDEPGYQTPGLITASIGIGVLRIVTTSPPTVHEIDMNFVLVPAGMDIDKTVNEVERAATIIAKTLHFSDKTYSIFHS